MTNIYSIKDGFLYQNDNQVLFKKSPNIGGQKKSKSYLIIHYDGANNATSAVNWMTDKASEVSAELSISRNGDVVQLVNFDVTAWHAGASEWKGTIGLNSHSIGIELQNNSVQEYTQVQLDELLLVAKCLVDTYNLKDVLGHSDIATPKGRKVDPGPKFPMTWLRDNIYKSKSSLITKSNLNLRLQPNTTSEILGTIPKGSKVILANLSNPNSDWVEVFVCELDKKGWVNKNYLE